MSQKKNSAFIAGIGYTIGNVLVKGINFLAVPLFSRLMTTAEFGVYNVFISYDAILSVIIGLALHSSIKSANYEFKGKINQYTSSVTLIYIINFVLFLVLILCFREPLGQLLGYDGLVLCWMVPFSFGGSILQLYNERISLDYSYKKYLLIAFVNSLGNVLLSLLLIFTVFRTQRDIGRIIGTTITIFVIAIFLLIEMYSRAKPKIIKKYWKFGIKYSFPIIPHGISQVLLSSFDRIMISRMVGNTEAGIYSLAGNLKLILTVISTSISTAWSTWFYSKIEKKEIHDIQVKATWLCELFTVFASALIALSPEVIIILGGREYAEGRYVAIPMIIDAFFLFLYNVIVPSEYYTKKTTFIMWGTVGAALINIVTNYIFIQQFGYLAAAYTTLFSYICYLLFHIKISRKMIGFYVIPIRILVILSTIIVAVAILSLYLIDSTFMRYLLCAAAVVTVGGHLLRSYIQGRE